MDIALEDLGYLGKGSWGEAFRAVHKKSGKSVALKRNLVLKDGNDEKRRIAAIHEAQVFQKLQGSQRIVPLFATFEDKTDNRGGLESRIYIVEELALGGTLKKRGLEPLSVRKRLAREFALSLKELHKSGFAHCDAHGGNVVIMPAHISDSTPKDQVIVKLIDLGLSMQLAGDKGDLIHNDIRQWWTVLYNDLFPNDSEFRKVWDNQTEFTSFDEILEHPFLQ